MMCCDVLCYAFAVVASCDHLSVFPVSSSVCSSVSCVVMMCCLSCRALLPLTHMHTFLSSLLVCYRRCEALAECRFFTFAAAPNGMCYLKRQSGVEVSGHSAEGLISGALLQ